MLLHSPTGEHVVSYFPIKNIRNNGGINICVHVLSIRNRSISLEIIPCSDIVMLYHSLCLTFKKPLKCFA